MGYPTKVQLIKRKESEQWYIYELWGAALGAGEDHFSGFMDEPSRETKPEKYLPNLAASVLYAVN